jgi:outer membrane protein OmpA-like peptidoglycan-associated protein
MKKAIFNLILVFFAGIVGTVSAQDSVSIANQKKIKELRARLNRIVMTEDSDDSLVSGLRLIISSQQDSIRWLKQIISQNKLWGSEDGIPLSNCHCLRVYYRLGRHQANYSRYPELDSLVMQLKKNLTLKLKLVGHADKSGSESYNYLLSRRRAEDMKAYLVGKYQIGPDRITAESKGSSEHIRALTDPYLFHLDRRVEAYIIELP